MSETIKLRLKQIPTVRSYCAKLMEKTGPTLLKERRPRKKDRALALVILIHNCQVSCLAKVSRRMIQNGCTPKTNKMAATLYNGSKPEVC